MRAWLVAVLALTSLDVCSLGAPFKAGDIVNVKEDSMWFLNQGELTVWQRFAKVASPEVLESYRSVVLGAREAWQFGGDQTVKILAYEPGYDAQAQVQMLEGRHKTVQWWVDISDLIPRKQSTPVTPTQDASAEDDLNRAWKELSPRMQAQLRPEQQRWIKYKDSLPTEERVRELRSGADYLRSLGGQ